MKLTIGEAREFVRARLDELAAQASDMLLSAIDDRNLDNTIDTLLEDAITYIHLAAPASLMEGPILTESNFAQGDLTVVDRVLDIDTALADIGDDILRFISFQCGDSDIKLTSAFYEDSPQARMQLNKFIQGQPDSPVLVKLDDSPNYKPHFKYYTTDMCLDGMGQALRFVLRYFARPKLQGDTLSVSPSSLTLGAGINSKSFTVSSSSSWSVISVLPDWISMGEMNGVAGTAFVSVSVLQNRGRAERSCSIVFANEESTATLEVTQRGYSNSEGDERLKVASTAMVNGVIKLPSTTISDVLNIRVAAEAGLAWQAVLSDTENFFISPVSGIGTGIENYSTMIVGANSVNDTGAARTATITFTATGVKPIVVNLRQPTQLTVTPRLPSVGSAAGTQSFTIATESSWSIELLQPVPEGFELSAMSGNGNSALLCSYPKNDTGELRLMGFRVSGGGATVQVVISQSAAPQESISVSPSILGEYPASGDTAGMATSATVTASSAWEFDPNTLPAWATVQRRANTNEIHVVSVNENTSIEARSATIVVWLASDHSKTASLTITQAAKQSSITILDSDVPLDFISVPSTGGTFTATLVATGPWNISSNKSWLSITSPTSGVAGTTTVTFTVASGSAADDGKIVGTLTDGSGKTCDYYVSREAAPVSQTFILLARYYKNWLYNNEDVANDGGSYAASLRASGSWTAVLGANSSWIHPLTQYGNWSGGATEDGVLFFDVDANAGAARTGTIIATLNDASPGDANGTSIFYVNQAGDGTITLEASFNTSTVEAAGGEVYLNISTQTGVSWYIDQVSSGLSIDSSDYSGNGPARITVTVGSTSQASGRNLSLRVNNTSYNLHSTASLHQNGPSAPSTRLSIVPNGTKNIEWDKTSQEIRILADNVNWTVSCPDSDVHFSSSSGSNNATITATFSPNSSTANNRQMTITVAGGGYTCVLYLIQAKKTAERLTVSPTSVTIPATGGSETIYVTTVGTWVLSKSADWIETSINAGRTSEATSFVISAQRNNEGARSGQVIVTGSGESKTITVSQGSGGTFTVDTDTVNLRQPANSSGAVTVYSVGAWVVYEGGSTIPDWLQYSYSTHVGSENGEVLTFTALTANNGSSPRTGSIVLALVGAPNSAPTITITVTQSAGSTLTISPTSLEASARGGDYEVDVTSNTDWRIVQISEGLSVDEDDASGTGDATVPIYVPGNPFSTSRPFSVTFRTADGAVTRTLTITQAAGELRASTTTVPEFSASGDTKTITLYSSAVWDIASSPSWISEIRPGSGYANTPDGQSITIKAAENTTSGTRSGQIIFRQSAYGNTLSVNVSQGAASAHTLTISPSEDVHLPNGDATTQQIVITSDTSWAVDLTGTFGCTVDIDHGTGNETITVTIPANTSTSGATVEQHRVKIKTTDNSITRTLDIWQPLNTDVISVVPDEVFIFTEEMSTAQAYIYCTRDWTAVSSQSWLQIRPTSGTANRQVTMYFTATLSKRNIQRATVTITSAGGVTKTIACRSMPSLEPVDPDDLEPDM